MTPRQAKAATARAGLAQALRVLTYRDDELGSIRADLIRADQRLARVQGANPCTEEQIVADAFGPATSHQSSQPESEIG